MRCMFFLGDKHFYMFKKNLSSIVNVNNLKKKLKQLASIISCCSFCVTTNVACASVNNSNIIEDLKIEQAPLVIAPLEVQYMSSSVCMEATAYSPDESGIVTASGHNLYDVIGWGCASNDFPIGTCLYIECPSAPWIDGTYTVLDTGGMGYGVVDIAMNNATECYEFGRRIIYVTVL